MMQGFRFEPPTVGDDRVVMRSRVTAALNLRFERRVTTVIAAAGYGKSTALALAIDNNRLDPVGVDLWLAATPADADPGHFIGGLAAAAGVDAGAADDTTVTRIVDAIWSLAPEDVVVIIDDAHELNDTDSLPTLRRLLDELPANAHLVLSSRVPVALPLARLRAHRELLEITEDDLALDDGEIEALRTLRPAADEVALPRHAATADLRLAAGLDAGADFLWEEILSGYDDDRLHHLRRLAVLEELDDGLVEVLTDGAFTLTELLAGTPLVDRQDDGSHRMHAILREALLSRLEPGEERKTLALAADAERRRGRFPQAVHLYHAAHDPIGALETARSFALSPTMLQTLDAVTTTRRVAEEIDPDSPVCRVLDAIGRFAGLESQVADSFVQAGAAARDAGDEELETLALYRAAQAQLLHHSDDYWTSHHRLGELAEVNDYARGVFGYLRSIIHQLAGEADEALAALDELDQLGRSTELVARAERLYDLARPEQVGIGLGPDDLAALPPGAGAFLGLSLWIRGDSTPAASAHVVAQSIERTLRQGFTHPAVSMLGTGAVIALANGDDADAERYAEHAGDLAATGVGESIVQVARVASAAVALVREGEAAAAAILAEDRAHPKHTDELVKWPYRAHLASLTMIYLCRPTLRPMLDSADLGPTHRTAVTAGQAIVALRERDDPALATSLPWNQVNLLRANVLPPHLTELACAATAAGVRSARAVIDVLPHVRRSLQRVAEVSSPVTVDVATELLGEIPRLEPFRLHAHLLGPVGLSRSGVTIDIPEFTKRPKVRELFALLVERRRVERRDVIEQLWPDHDDEERALASLRTTLSTLNNVLDPDRERGASAFHLHVDAERITLDDRVTDDVSDFERLIDAAGADDRSGLPARALDTYREAIALYRGDYLAGLDAGWIVLTRLRLRSLAITALCRIAELVAARGEPEQAARWAAQARDLEPTNERAARQFVGALDATGDRPAARNAARELARTLEAAGITPDAATSRMFARLG